MFPPPPSTAEAAKSGAQLKPFIVFVYRFRLTFVWTEGYGYGDIMYGTTYMWKVHGLARPLPDGLCSARS